MKQLKAFSNSAQRLSLDSPAMYRITIQGRLGLEWSDWFEGMALTPAAGSHGATTILTGLVRDQAALYGLLNTLYSLGLPLLDLTCLEINPTPEK